MNSQSTLERAFELARSGDCRIVDDIRRKLKSERFSQVDEHLSGPSIKRQLHKLCIEAQEARRTSTESETP